MKFEFINGYVYSLNKNVVLKEMAEYYSKIDGISFGEALDNLEDTDSSEIEEFLLNNMEWEEISDHVRLIERPELFEPDVSWPDVDFVYD